MAARAALVALAAATLCGHTARAARVQLSQRRQQNGLEVQQKASEFIAENAEAASQRLFEWTSKYLKQRQDSDFQWKKLLQASGWHIGDPLGSGSIGSIFEVKKEGFGDSVAKVVTLNLDFYKSVMTWSHPHNDARRLAAQAVAGQAIAAQLGHAPKVHDAFFNKPPEGTPEWVIVMEKINGMSLCDFADDEKLRPEWKSKAHVGCKWSENYGSTNKDPMPQQAYDSIVKVVEQLNSYGVLTWDTSSENIMIDPHAPGNVTFIDFDLVTNPQPKWDSQTALAWVFNQWLKCPHPYDGVEGAKLAEMARKIVEIG
mmetsp:Transcript_57871/g.176283  ORF Transcript_57871/g.176283 Transcript_57871/m.176283 type:complete len:314 (-) Transcript_57871:98-1039(-)